LAGEVLLKILFMVKIIVRITWQLGFEQGHFCLAKKDHYDGAPARMAVAAYLLALPAKNLVNERELYV